MPNLLIVDDERQILNSLQRELRETPWSVTACNDPAKAMELLETKAFDVVLSDYRMPRITGVQVLACARRHQPTSARIILSGYTDATAMLQAVNEAELFRYLVKPWTPEELTNALSAALKRRKELKVGRMLIAQKLRERDLEKRRQDAVQQFERKERIAFSP
ncbi:MAG: response regulator [Gammaproteobacteria bacterium]|nr:response regulator [Gammaproteobacteria bacterium]NNL49782.1 response regulator [Woeseiaceae bacterium]